MSDENLDVKQLLHGVAILFSFYAGYKYGTSVLMKKFQDDPSCSSEMDDTGDKVFSDSGNYKMMLVVRNDLKMGKGKIAAQCGHAAIGAYQSAAKKAPKILRRWLQSGCTKIAVKVESEQELLRIRRAAQEYHLNNCMIRDAGRTQIEPNAITVLAVGPAAEEEVDKVTGHLKLL